MSDITQNFEINSIDLGVTVDTNQLTFTPDAISLNLYASGGGPATALNANIENVHIYGGTNGYVLQTDGTGNLSWTAQSGGGGNGAPGGSNTQVQYNNSGVFAGNTGFTYNQTTGLLSSQYYSGNANGLFNIIASNIVGTVANATYALSAGTANTVTTAAQPNITSVGTLTSLDVTGNTTSGNFVGVFANGNSNVSIPAANGNINLSSAGNANVVIVTGTGLNVAGNISGANANLGNLVVANYFSGNGSLLTGITAGNIIGNVANANYAAYAGNITIAAQPNITSVGRLTDLFVTSTRIHLGFQAGYIGSNSTTQGANAVAIGTNAGNVSQSINSIAIGYQAGSNAQAANAVAIGYGAAQAGQGSYATAVGSGAGGFNQGSRATGVGLGAGGITQGANATAVGTNAGQDNQGIRSVAIGTYAGSLYQGTHAIAIGANAAYSNQHISSIMLNATGANLNTTQANSFFVKPIRDVTGNVDFTVTLKYNPTTGEIGYV